MKSLPNLSVRRAVPRDSEQLCQLADELILLPIGSDRETMLKALLQDHDRVVYVADANGLLVGFIELRIFPDFVEGAPIAVIQNLIVREAYRRLGIGTGLMEKASEEAKKRSAKEIHVWTESSNEKAIHFYTKHGFERKALLFEKILG